jgi:hypothetical protein
LGDDGMGWTVDQLLENLINAGESRVRLAIITGQLQSIKNGRSSSILPERATTDSRHIWLTTSQSAPVQIGSGSKSRDCPQPGVEPER